MATGGPDGYKFKCAPPAFADLIKGVTKSVYYWWWAYLRENRRYLECCERGGRGKQEWLYRHFGDVRAENFLGWWTEHLRGPMLFAERPKLPITVLDSPRDWNASWQKNDVLVIALPLSLGTDELIDGVRRRLNYVRPRGRGRPKKGTLPSTALFPVAGAFNLHTLRKGLEVYKAVAWRREAGARFTYEQIGRELGMAKGRGFDSDQRDAIRATVTQHLRRAEIMIHNVGLGEFPKGDVRLHESDVV